MIIKNLLFTAIIFSLTQILPAAAGITGQNMVSDAPILVKAGKDCSALVKSNSTPAPWSQLLVDLNLANLNPADLNLADLNPAVSNPADLNPADLKKGESFTNIFDIFKASDLAQASEIKKGLDFDRISDATVTNCPINEVPIPAAGWLFASALLGFITFSNRHRA